MTLARYLLSEVFTGRDQGTKMDPRLLLDPKAALKNKKKAGSSEGALTAFPSTRVMPGGDTLETDFSRTSLFTRLHFLPRPRTY